MKGCTEYEMAKLMQEEQIASTTTSSPAIYRGRLVLPLVKGRFDDVGLPQENIP
jgi:hypothetical protein